MGMTSDHIAYLAMLVSIVALIVSFLSYYSDRYRIQVTRSIFEFYPQEWSLQIHAVNVGKRAISLQHVLFCPADHPGIYLNFASDGRPVHLDVGMPFTRDFFPSEFKDAGKKYGGWSSLEELAKLKVFVVDAAGKKHKARAGGKPLLQRLHQ